MFAGILLHFPVRDEVVGIVHFVVCITIELPFFITMTLHILFLHVEEAETLHLNVTVIFLRFVCFSC